MENPNLFTKLNSKHPINFKVLKAYVLKIYMVFSTTNSAVPLNNPPHTNNL